MKRIETTTFFVVGSPNGWSCAHKHETYESAKDCYNKERLEVANKHQYLWVEQIHRVDTHTKLFEDHGDPMARQRESFNLGGLDEKPIKTLIKVVQASSEYQSLPEVATQTKAAAKRLSGQSHKTKITMCIVCFKIFTGDKRSYYCKKTKCRNDARYWPERKKHSAIIERDNKLKQMQKNNIGASLVEANNDVSSEPLTAGEILRQKARPPVEITCCLCGDKEFRDRRAQICTKQECKRKADQQRKQRQRKKKVSVA